jgi:fermentation-respiration switch protein FrsA (DUF1100 family)
VIGSSMGGAIVAQYLLHASDVPPTAGAILDAPVLDWNATLALAARRRGVPGPLASAAKRLAASRVRVSFGELDLVRHADRLTTPILIFHGDDDLTVPIASSEALAGARPDLVRLVRVAGAGHVQSWNHAPARYADCVRVFIADLPEG